MRYLWLICVLVALTAIGPSRAADWKMIAGDASAFSSDCIGDTSTIECLVDTFVACEAWSLDRQYTSSDDDYISPVCFAPGGDPTYGYSIGFLGQLADPRLYVTFYFWDAWTLTEADTLVEGFPRASPSPIEAGDTVVDLYLMRCTPRSSCIEAQPASASLENLAKACPPTDCRGAPTYEISSNASDSDVRMIKPMISIFLRQDVGGQWQLHYHYPGGHPRAGPYWEPDHWKVK